MCKVHVSMSIIVDTCIYICTFICIHFVYVRVYIYIHTYVSSIVDVSDTWSCKLGSCGCSSGWATDKAT